MVPFEIAYPNTIKKDFALKAILRAGIFPFDRTNMALKFCIAESSQSKIKLHLHPKLRSNITPRMFQKQNHQLLCHVTCKLYNLLESQVRLLEKNKTPQ